VDNPEASVEELKRSITDLGLKDALISGTVNGQFLDDPKFLPILKILKNAMLLGLLCLLQNSLILVKWKNLYSRYCLAIGRRPM
jgi:predicted TIM-barrel fold metal-dependent hydrolase